VSGKNRTTFNQMIQLDIEYAERSSLALDLMIILKTLPALWRQCQDIRTQKRNPNANATGTRA
jgi:lipopolysaccharide/colanic/teichoic acid biosynthesis glycosyltransferase